MPDRPDIEAIKALDPTTVLAAAREFVSAMVGCECDDTLDCQHGKARTAAWEAWSAALEAASPNPLDEEMDQAAHLVIALVEPLVAEVERLRNDRLVLDDHQVCDAEIRRLRTALERIATQCVPEDHLAVLIARAALYPEEPSGGD